MDSRTVPESLPPSLTSVSHQPPLFDGTTKHTLYTELYTAYLCPFAQRAWITRNYKGLQDEIKLVPIDLQDKPAWYKEKVYPPNKVPSLEHNNKVLGESIDIMKYIDVNFKGPSLFPDDPAKREYGEQLLAYADTFFSLVVGSFKEDVARAAVPFDYLEHALHTFDDGPFFLGQFSLVDIAYIPFVERFPIFLKEVFGYDIISGRPKLVAWIEELNKIDAYTQTKLDPRVVLEHTKKRFLG